MDKDSYSLLKHYMSDLNWYNNYENILTVGRILKDECILNSVDTTFDYFNKPWHFEPEIKDLIKEHELDLVSEGFFSLPIYDRGLSLDWMFTFGIVSKDAYELLFDDMEGKL